MRSVVHTAALPARMLKSPSDRRSRIVAPDNQFELAECKAAKQYRSPCRTIAEEDKRYEGRVMKKLSFPNSGSFQVSSAGEKGIPSPNWLPA